MVIDWIVLNHRHINMTYVFQNQYKYAKLLIDINQGEANASYIRIGTLISNKLQWVKRQNHSLIP